MRGRIATLALLIVFLAGTAPVLAQSVPLVPGIGAKAGVNFSNVQLEGNSTSKRTGFIGGVYGIAPLNAIVSLELDLLYSQKGFHKNSYEDITNWDLKTDYIELPIICRFDIPTDVFHPYVFFGFSPSVLLSAEQKNSETGDQWEDVKSQLNTTNWTTVFGVGGTNNNLLIEGRFSYGLSDMGKDEYGAELKDLTFSIMLGYTFFQ